MSFALRRVPVLVQLPKGQQVDFTPEGTGQLQPLRRFWSPIEEQKHNLGNICWSASSSWLKKRKHLLHFTLSL